MLWLYRDDHNRIFVFLDILEISEISPRRNMYIIIIFGGYSCYKWDVKSN